MRPENSPSFLITNFFLLTRRREREEEEERSSSTLCPEINAIT